MFRNIYFDVVGGCNAQCPLCSTARTSFGRKVEHISASEFGRALDRLLSLGLVERNKTNVGIYNWGEPLLHPDLDGILSAAAERELQIGISTNASKKVRVTTSTKHVASIIFSVPGWSQASYDKIHGFKFDRIVANIESLIDNFRAHGYLGAPILRYHSYKFNGGDEFEQAQKWCDAHGVIMRSYRAYIADYEQCQSFLNGRTSPDALRDITEKLHLDYVDGLIRSRPVDWRCPQFDSHLVLDHKSNILLCCVLPQTHVIGSVFDLSREEVLSRKTSDPECESCIRSGTAFWVHNPKQVPRSVPTPILTDLEIFARLASRKAARALPRAWTTAARIIAQKSAPH